MRRSWLLVVLALCLGLVLTGCNERRAMVTIDSAALAGEITLFDREYEEVRAAILARWATLSHEDRMQLAAASGALLRLRDRLGVLVDGSGGQRLIALASLRAAIGEARSAYRSAREWWGRERETYPGALRAEIDDFDARATSIGLRLDRLANAVPETEVTSEVSAALELGSLALQVMGSR